MNARPGGAPASAGAPPHAAPQGAAPFDGAAEAYDAAFSDRRLGLLLRGLLHEELGRHLPASGLHLECGCGTGLDALWMLRRGAAVVATDVSPAMRAATIARLRAAVGREGAAALTPRDAGEPLDVASRGGAPLAVPDAHGEGDVASDDAPGQRASPRRHAAAGVAAVADLDLAGAPMHRRRQLVGAAAVAHLDLADPAPPTRPEYSTHDDPRLRPLSSGIPFDGVFDGCFSSFGPLNCVLDRRPLAAALQRWLRPGARVCFVVMPRLAPWDWLWYGAHLRPSAALRRLRRAPVAGLPGGGRLRLDYPSARDLDAELGPSFRRLDHRAIGALLPISEAAGLVSRAPLLFEAVATLEREVAARWPWPHLCDHALHVWERR